MEPKNTVFDGEKITEQMAAIRRTEIATAAMQSLIITEDAVEVLNGSRAGHVAILATKYADALIKELNKPKENGK